MIGNPFYIQELQYAIRCQRLSMEVLKNIVLYKEHKYSRDEIRKILKTHYKDHGIIEEGSTMRILDSTFHFKFAGNQFIDIVIHE
jgi:hypothetical protein